MDSGIALMIAMFRRYLKRKSASKQATSCFIKDVPLFHLGLPTVLWEVSELILARTISFADLTVPYGIYFIIPVVIYLGL